MKRLFDVLVGAAALAIVAPLLTVVALVIGLVEGRPVMFRQRRSGRGGRPFDLVKFRTMRHSESPLWNPLHDRGRTTGLGRALRSSSLDELPTIADVVTGKMSLVGPRPLPVKYLPRYTDRQARRLEVRPGVTGWAQVNGRNTLSWDERLELDVWYVDHRTFRLDLWILATTLRQVVRREGVDHDDRVTMTEFRGSGR